MNMLSSHIEAEEAVRLRRSATIRNGSIAIVALLLAGGAWKLTHQAPAQAAPTPERIY